MHFPFTVLYGGRHSDFLKILKIMICYKSNKNIFKICGSYQVQDCTGRNRKCITHADDQMLVIYRVLGQMAL